MSKSYSSILLMFFILLVSFPLNASAEADLPAFAIGPQEARNYLIFIWSSDSVDSAIGYHNVLRLLNEEIEKGRLRVVFIQIGGKSPNDLGTGPLFLCASGKDNYASLVMQYLRQFDNRFSITGNWYISDLMRTLGPRYGLPADVATCHEGKSGQFRRDELSAVSAVTMSKFKISAAPAYFLNSKPIYPSNADDIRRRLNE